MDTLFYIWGEKAITGNNWSQEDDLSAIFSGYLNLPTDYYYFKMSCDDQCILTIDNQEIINVFWTEDEKYGEIWLQGDVSHTFELKFFEDWGHARIKLHMHGSEDDEW